jgi:hypothetical protein
MRVIVDMLPIPCAECGHEIGVLVVDKGKGAEMRGYLSDNQVYAICAGCRNVIDAGDASISEEKK